MKFISAYYFLPLFPALALSTRQGYEELEKQLKEVFMERSNILRQLSKTSKELEGIKVNLQVPRPSQPCTPPPQPKTTSTARKSWGHFILQDLQSSTTLLEHAVLQSLKNDKSSVKSDVQNLLELGQKQREDMHVLQETFKKQLNEAAEKAEKQQATINFLKTEMERKSKMIRDLQNENKSLKNKLLSGNKLCGIHAEEIMQSKKIQAQLKDLRYGKKDLIFKAQQLTDLEQKLAVAKNELDKAELDKESQLKALKETVQICLSSVLHNQPPTINLTPSKPTDRLISPVTNASNDPIHLANTEPQESISDSKGNLAKQSAKKHNQSIPDCDPQDVGKRCVVNNNNASSVNDNTATSDLSIQKLHGPPWIKPKVKKTMEYNLKDTDYFNKTEEKTL